MCPENEQVFPQTFGSDSGAPFDPEQLYCTLALPIKELEIGMEPDVLIINSAATSEQNVCFFFIPMSRPF